MGMEVQVLLQKLGRIRAEVALEIEPAIRHGDKAIVRALGKVRDALNDAMIAVGDEKSTRCAEGIAIPKS